MLHHITPSILLKETKSALGNFLAEKKSVAF